MPESRAAGFAGWACLLALGLLAAGGAARTPEGVLLGTPSLWGSLALVGGVTLGVARLGAAAGRSGLGLIPFLVAPLLAPWAPGLAAWTGPPLFAIVAGFLLSLIAAEAGARVGRAARWLLLPGLFLVYAVAAGRVQLQVGPDGDEPHYLMVADSLLRDRDLSLERDYAERRYQAFYKKDELAPHYRVRGKGGQIYSLHAVGLSLLILPAYALGGYPAVSFFMAFLLACLVVELRALLADCLEDERLATAVAWLVGLSPPLIHYAGLVFTEVPAGLLVALALRRGLRSSQTLPATATLALAAAALPWLNVRYAAFAVLLFIPPLARRADRRRLAVLVAPALASAAGLALYHQALYGFYDPRRVYGLRPELSLAQLPEGLPGLLLDQEFGLLAYAPVFILAVPGLFVWIRRRPSAGWLGFALVAAACALAGSWHMWRGGFNPPARFLVPVVPVLALAVAMAIRRGLGAGAWALAGWGVWIGVLGAWQPHLVHRDRDGTAPFFRAYAGAEEWTRLLPGYVLAEPDRRRLSAVWVAALGTVALGASRGGSRRGARRWATFGLLALAASSSATAVSSREAGGREAIHLIGRRAWAWPGGAFLESAPARWRPSELDWGPAYEPHRHPDGASIGERFQLPAGRYRLGVAAELLGESLPTLVVRPPPGTGPSREAATTRNAGGIEARFEIAEGTTEVTLLLSRGSPLVLGELQLEALNP